ncbi:hypothetical protein [Ornithinibacillus sp. JPR2-1]|uniref:hypothetical protein n=1 Tax=Ornithinibacillus sp. JPR2-1 TaxID=2094019 RepID=UPI0031DEA452
MLTIIRGSLPELRKEMDHYKKQQQDNVRFVKKEYKGNSVLSKKVAEAEKLVEKYSFTKCTPVRIDHIVINYKLYTAFIKKLKRAHYTEKLVDWKLVISYKDGPATGKLELFDISTAYTKLQHIPTAVFEEVSR